MKNKRLKFIVTLVASLILFTACSDSGEPSNNKITDTRQTVLLNSFDAYENVFASRWSKFFGKAAVNTDSNYISEGNGSMLVCPQGNQTSEYEYPTVTYNCEDSFKTKDFSAFDNLLIDVYNSDNRTAHIAITLHVFGDDSKLHDTGFKFFPIKANGWTCVNLDLSDGSLRSGFYGLNDVREISFAFKEYIVEEGAEPISLYLDNFRAVKAETVSTYNPKRNPGAILDFEHAGDINLLSYSYNGYLCEISVSDNFVKEGRNAAKITVNKMKTSQDFYGYPNWRYHVNENVFGNSVGLSGQRLLVDIYNDSVVDNILVFSVILADGSTLSNKFTVKANEWTTMSLKFESDADVKAISLGNDEYYITYYATEESTLYVDNLRLEA